MRRAAGPCFSGKTGCCVTRPSAKSSAHTSFGKKKWAERSPCRWPISCLPTLNANSPRRPGPASTPSQAETSSAICLLGEVVVLLRLRRRVGRGQRERRVDVLGEAHGNAVLHRPHVCGPVAGLLTARAQPSPDVSGGDDDV